MENRRLDASSQMADPECPTCGKKVFFNERFNVLNKTYHKRCFKCTKCSKTLELGKHVDNGGEPYCQSCHSKSHGPRGYGYGTGAGIMTGNYDGNNQTRTPEKRSSVAKKVTPSPAAASEYHKVKNVDDEVFGETQQEVVQEKTRKEDKRESKRKSTRAVAKPEGFKGVVEQIKELCGCGRKTVRD